MTGPTAAQSRDRAFGSTVVLTGFIIQPNALLDSDNPTVNPLTP